MSTIHKVVETAAELVKQLILLIFKQESSSEAIDDHNEPTKPTE